MSSPQKSILVVNPWIHDFAAYDLWMKPLGLLYIASILRARGFGVTLLDCLDFHSLPEECRNGVKPPSKKSFGQGHFHKEVIPKPKPLKKIPRQYRRYGIPPETLNRLAPKIPAPDLILVTSSMTYWYTGVAETVRFLKVHFPGIPILLGGTYATLCADHARKNSGADQVLPGPWDDEKMEFISGLLGTKAAEAREGGFASWLYPAFDLYRQLVYICLLTRRGCPFSCAYCASSRLNPGFESRTPEAVVEEIVHWRKVSGISNFSFHDDALLVEPERHFLPIARGLAERGAECNFHTPNALHVRFLDEEVANALFRSGFRTIRLGLETSGEDLQRRTGGKVTNRQFEAGVRNLRRAGYRQEEIGVYLMVGLPGQRAKDVSESISFVKASGARPILAEYSPIPGTPLFADAAKVSPFDLENEPLFHNNSLLPCRSEDLTWEDYRVLKAEAGE
ncbi:MAG TPA: B12-binding domain-containing radical SAM protein [Thermodesulfobacteriota bacterium]|nr:B12-binding domain-containing radical SAM protein [Thermodesulfobacteriota bacterium]